MDAYRVGNIYEGKDSKMLYRIEEIFYISSTMLHKRYRVYRQEDRSKSDHFTVEMVDKFFIKYPYDEQI
jgi:hypothetical protein